MEITADTWAAGSAQLADAGVTIGANVRVSVGDFTVGAGVVIRDNVTIVADSLELGDGVVIDAGCDLRSGRISLGRRTELQRNVRVLVADSFVVAEAGRVERDVSITCRSFEAGRLLYLGNDSSVGYGGTTASTSHVKIGDRVAIGPHSILNANDSITFEDQVGSGCYLSVWTHGFHFGHRLLDGYEATLAPVHVARNAWLGYHVTLLPGTTIGENTILAAGAVAASDLPANVLAAGIPATVKRELSATVMKDDVARERIDGIMSAWVAELDWKGYSARLIDDGVVEFEQSHLFYLDAPGTDRGAAGEQRRVVVLSLEDKPRPEHGGDGSLTFLLRSGVLIGELDAVSHDLRDFLRRHALPCGDQHCFESLPNKRFQRLVNTFA
ncbi:hypothetical protein GXW82_43170 [Streptacidiphilus sp. 4-A2]|nr:hypothetical protein [Streptacidiphilus sp. 4-A2]